MRTGIYNIYVTESFSCQLRQDVELSAAQFWGRSLAYHFISMRTGIYNIYVTESFSCQLRQDVELSAAKAGIVCQNGQIEFAPGIGAPGGD
jgi:hypothetical protein